MSTIASPFTPGSAAEAGGRFTLDPATTLNIGDGERVAVGVDRKSKSHLVWAYGGTQLGVPIPAVASAIASTKVIAPAAVVGAFEAMGTLDKLVKAVESATGRKLAPAPTPKP